MFVAYQQRNRRRHKFPTAGPRKLLKHYEMDADVKLFNWNSHSERVHQSVEEPSD